MDTATIILFAIRAAVRMGVQAQRAYVDSTRSRKLVLPLPNFKASRGFASAREFFIQQPRDGLKPDALKDLVTRMVDQQETLSEIEQQALVDFHTDALLLMWAPSHAMRTQDGSPLERQAMVSLVTIRQWQRGTEPHPSTAQRLAGALIETGIDYFTNVPGAINENSKGGRAALAVLRGLSDVHFSEAELGNLPQRLLLGALEALGEESALISSDPKVQKLISTVTSSLVVDAERHIAAIRAEEGSSNTVREERVREWAEVVFRSMVSSGGRMVVENPAELLSIEQEGHQALVSKVGTALLDLVVESPEGELDAIFSMNSLEVLADSALSTIGKHPEILVEGGDAALKSLLGSIATELAGYDKLFQTSMLPEIGRMVLAKTGENLWLLWPELANDPAKNLLLTGASTALAALTREAEDGERWKPRFGRDELIEVTEAVLDQFVENPGWLLSEAGEVNENLQVALEAAVGVLRDRGDRRLSTKLASGILKTSLVAVASRQDFLQELPAEGKVAVAAVLDAVLGQIFAGDLDPKAAWVLTRGEVVKGVVDIAFDQLERAGLDDANIGKLRTLIRQRAAAIVAGDAFDLAEFETLLKERLDA